MKRPDHVDREYPLPVFVLHLFEIGGQHELRRPGVVHQHVDAAKGFGGRGGHLPAIGVVGHVGLYGDSLDAQLFDVGGRLLGLVA